MSNSVFSFEQGAFVQPVPFIVTQVANRQEFDNLDLIANFAYRFMSNNYEQIGSPNEQALILPGEPAGSSHYPRWLDTLSIYHVRAHTETAFHLAHELLALIPDDTLDPHDKYLTLVSVLLHDIIRHYVVRLSESESGLVYYTRTPSRGRDETESSQLGASLMNLFGNSKRDQEFVRSTIQATLPTWDDRHQTIRPAMDIREMSLSQMIMSAVDINLPGLDAVAQNEAADAVFLEEFRPDSILDVMSRNEPPEERDGAVARYQGFLWDQAVLYIPGRERMFQEVELPRFVHLSAGAVEDRMTDFKRSRDMAADKVYTLRQPTQSGQMAIPLDVYYDTMTGVMDRRLNHTTRPLEYAA